MAVKAKDNNERPWNEIVPKHYHWMKKVFSKEEAKRFPKSQSWDITIDFTKEAPPVLDCKYIH